MIFRLYETLRDSHTGVPIEKDLDNILLLLVFNLCAVSVVVSHLAPNQKMGVRFLHGVLVFSLNISPGLTLGKY